VARPRPSLPGLRPYLHAVVLGTAIALFSLAFLAAMVWLQTLLFSTLPDRLDVREPLWILAVCVTGGLLVGVLNRSIERGRDTAHDVDEAIADSHAAAEGADQSPRVFFGRVGLGGSGIADEHAEIRYVGRGRGGVQGRGGVCGLGASHGRIGPSDRRRHTARGPD
jgi:hypothetical protein